MTSLPRPTPAALSGAAPKPVPAPVIVTPLMRALPNWLTASRVAMAVVFFVVLTLWRWDDSAAAAGKTDWFMLAAAAVFTIAVATDALDGYLARKWKAESVFGRIMDPFADKILIVGSFVFLAGPDFWVSVPAAHGLAGHGMQVSGIYPWMVVVLLARELLVTSIRGVLESQGMTFASDWWGKGKMILQSIMIPAVLVLIAITPVTPVRDAAGVPLGLPWGRIAIDALVWTTLAVTVISGVPYVRRCFVILAQWQRDKREARRESQ